MSGKWVSSEEIQKHHAELETKDIPECSLCGEKPDHIGKIVAGRGGIFIGRICISNACEALKDTGFPVGK